MMKNYKDCLKTQKEEYQLKDIQQMIACFEDEILPNLPSQDEILRRAKQRKLKRQSTMTNSLLAIAAITVGVYWYNPAYQQQHYATQLGEQQDIMLSDGSQIKLNTQTQIHVRQRLRSREIVLLQGEAVFSVAHGKNPASKLFERTFTVQAGQILVRDIGTIFNVKKYSDLHVDVTVLEGEVEVRYLNSSQPVIPLLQGQAISTHQMMDLKHVEAVDTYAVSAWQSGRVVFKQTPLEQAVRDFQRYGDFKVEFNNGSLKEIPIYGQFQAMNYHQFMQILPNIAPVKVMSRGENHWIITQK